ncbi:MAG: SprT family zinc-dependent metalloprotease [Arcobacteraceae bacterium]|nr:SprT family zinc-dependent metalloprotease [Arcobacteraceae bacterium]
MNFSVKIDNEDITVHFEKSKKMKRCYIRIVDAKTIRIKAHWYYSLEEAKALIQQKMLWLEKHIVPLKAKLLQPHEFYFLGRVCLLEDFNLTQEQIDGFYKQKAQEILPDIVQKYAQKMNAFPSCLKFRKTKSRWGSCSYNNVINLSTNLMKLPFSCVDYIVIHELAHIKHKNHSKAFWDWVEVHCPNYKEEEKKIKYF